MTGFQKWILFFIFSFSCFAREPLFLGASIPKSGTHLLSKLFKLLTDSSYVGGWDGCLSKEQLEDLLLHLDYKKLYPLSHADEPHYLEFAKSHPEYIKLFQIRDLRDTLVSAMFFFDSNLEELGLKSFDEKLTFMITSDTVFSNWIENNAKVSLSWISLPNTFVIRFEDLVGKKGQGSEEKQRETIILISSLIDIHLTQDQLDWIVDHLFGEVKDPVSWTFRSGQIGDWKNYFLPHHQQLFNQRWGTFQQALGYPLFETGIDE